ncbi:uncharacterized protein [Paramormyrops kingsleyae]|uniref:uncharacterized protein isoform X2 n=1 Tax=Paramormyrops kingsleyae TaxID=1676925 RepID=UPI003B96DE86
MTSGLTVGDGKMIPVQIKSFICDAPARALIKGTVAFNSRHGCDFCEVCGKFDGRMMFLYCGAPRTNESFRNQKNRLRPLPSLLSAYVNEKVLQQNVQNVCVEKNTWHPFFFFYQFIDNLNKKDRTERTPKASSLALKPLPTPTPYNDSTEESPPSTSARPYPLTPTCAYSPELEIGTKPMLIETGSKPTTTSGTIAETYLKKICDIAVETFKAVEEIRMTATIMQEDITKIKAALVTHLPEGEREEVFAIKIHDTPEEFEEFCCKLEDPNFKKLVISFMVATYGQKSIGETVRAILKASMTDSLMARYNRTGTRNMKSLPDIFEKCSLSFESDEIKVKRGKEEITTTVKRETGKQLEIYLSNAASRVRRKSGQNTP